VFAQTYPCCTCEGKRTTFQQWVLCSHFVVLRNWTQVILLGDMFLYSLSHFAGSSYSFHLLYSYFTLLCVCVCVCVRGGGGMTNWLYACVPSTEWRLEDNFQEADFSFVFRCGLWASWYVYFRSSDTWACDSYITCRVCLDLGCGDLIKGIKLVWHMKLVFWPGFAFFFFVFFL
jgi:hypothetical protein